jgi:hypothetical protein
MHSDSVGFRLARLVQGPCPLPFHPTAALSGEGASCSRHCFFSIAGTSPHRPGRQSHGRRDSSLPSVSASLPKGHPSSFCGGGDGGKQCRGRKARQRPVDDPPSVPRWGRGAGDGGRIGRRSGAPGRSGGGGGGGDRGVGRESALGPGPRSLACRASLSAAAAAC